MKLTTKQREFVIIIRSSGGVVAADKGLFFIPTTGQRLHAMVINNLISKKALISSDDGLFPGFKTQTYQLNTCN